MGYDCPWVVYVFRPLCLGQPFSVIVEVERAGFKVAYSVVLVLQHLLQKHREISHVDSLPCVSTLLFPFCCGLDLPPGMTEATSSVSSQFTEQNMPMLLSDSGVI